MMPVNKLSQISWVSHVPAVLNNNQLIDEWQSRAAGNCRFREQREIALWRLRICLESNHTGLNLSNLHLTQPPSLFPTGLETLSLECNCLYALPEHLPASLQIPDVSNNLLTRLPETLPASLETLGVSYNQLTRLPGDFSNILNINNNPLIYPPQYFTKQIACWTSETDGG